MLVLFFLPQIGLERRGLDRRILGLMGYPLPKKKGQFQNWDYLKSGFANSLPGLARYWFRRGGVIPPNLIKLILAYPIMEYVRRLSLPILTYGSMLVLLCCSSYPQVKLLTTELNRIILNADRLSYPQINLLTTELNRIILNVDRLSYPQHFAIKNR